MKQRFIYTNGRTTALHHAQHIVVTQNIKTGSIYVHAIC